ncbi:MAG: acyl-ACP desaturase [Deltaproteobacteria bacterium]|nr:acyl-ACP desaturase [Deltaproteobacteria bacterium]
MRTSYNTEFSREAQAEYDQFMAKAETVRWTPAAIKYDQIDYSKLTTADLFAVFVTLHIENYSDVYTRLLLENYADVPLVASFIRNWEREEENHARVLEKYLMTVGIPIDELRANYAKVDKRDFPFPSRNQTGLNVFVFFQELMTREMYTKMLKACKEPVLVDILKRVVRDEERHYRYYRHSLQLRLKLDRDDTFHQFRKIVRIFGMPLTMFRQQAMTDKLMEYFPYSLADIMNIADPVIKFLEDAPSPWLAWAPKLQRLAQLRRPLSYLMQSPYFWGHVSISLRTRLGLSNIPQADKEYVQAVVERLHGLLTARSAEVAVHYGLAASRLGVADCLVAENAHAILQSFKHIACRVHARRCLDITFELGSDDKDFFFGSSGVGCLSGFGVFGVFHIILLRLRRQLLSVLLARWRNAFFGPRIFMVHHGNMGIPARNGAEGQSGTLAIAR